MGHLLRVLRLHATLLAIAALVTGALVSAAPVATAEPTATYATSLRVLNAGDATYGPATPVIAEMRTVSGPKSPRGGLVQFTVDGETFGDPVPLVTLQNVISWVATLVVPADFPAGDHLVEARFLGDEEYQPSSGSLIHRILPATTTTGLTVDTAAARVGEAITLDATVDVQPPGAGDPTGDVQFLADDQPIGSPVPLDGDHATLVVNSLPAGTRAITATYSGDNNFRTSTSSSTSVSITKWATTLTAEPALLRINPFGVPLGQLRATLRRTDGPVAGAAITFTAGSRVVCTSVTDTSGVAVCAGASRLLDLVLELGYRVNYAGSEANLSAAARGGILG